MRVISKHIDPFVRSPIRDAIIRPPTPLVPTPLPIISPTRISITTVDPAKLIAANQLQASSTADNRLQSPAPKKLSFAEKARKFIPAAAAAAGTLAFLLPLNAMASEGILANTFALYVPNSFSPTVGLVIAAGMIALGAVYTSRYLFHFYREATHQSRVGSVTTGNTTPHQLIKTQLFPLWKVSFGVGSALALMPELDLLIGGSFIHPLINFNWLPTLVVGTTFLTAWAISSIRDLYRAKFGNKTLKPQPMLGKQLTNAGALAAKFFTVVSSFYMMQVYGTHTLHMLHCLIKNVASLAGLYSWGPIGYTALAGAGLGIAIKLVSNRGEIWTILREQTLPSLKTKKPLRLLASLAANTWRLTYNLAKAAARPAALGVGLFLASKIIGTSLAVGTIGSLASFIAVPAAIGFVAFLLFDKPRFYLYHPLEKEHYPPRFSADWWKRSAAWSGILAGGTSLTMLLGGPAMLFSNLACFGLTVGFSHMFPHSFRSQINAEVMKDTPPRTYSLTDLTKPFGPRSASGPSTTTNKPGMTNARDGSLLSAAIMMIIECMPNRVINACSGAFASKDYWEAREMAMFINWDNGYLRDIWSRAADRVKAATLPESVYSALADGYQELADAVNNPAALHLNQGHPLGYGDILSRYTLFFIETLGSRHSAIQAAVGPIASDATLDLPGKIKRIKELAADEKTPNLVKNALSLFIGNGAPADSQFRVAAYSPGAALRRQDNDLISHGFLLQRMGNLAASAANYYRTAARNVRLADLQGDAFRVLNYEMSRAFSHLDVKPVRFWDSILIDSFKGKLEVADVCFQVSHEFVSLMVITVLTPDGQVKNWPIPLRVARDFRPDYKSVAVANSRHREGEDLRQGWYDRFDPAHGGHGAHDIGNSLCAVAMLDNFDHHSKHKDDLTLYPTFELAIRAPRLADDEYYDLTLPNGVKLRIFGSGQMEQISARGGLPPNSPIILAVPGTRRHECLAQQLKNQPNINPALRARLEKGDIPHPFGGSLTLDPGLANGIHHLPVTELLGVSDADQMQVNISNMAIYLQEVAPHLRFMFWRRRLEDFPFYEIETNRESEHDSIISVGIALSWMLTKVVTPDGITHYVPLNICMENEKTFGRGMEARLWGYIDNAKPLELRCVGGKYYLRIHYAADAEKDSDFQQARLIEDKPGITDQELEQALAAWRMNGANYNDRQPIDLIPVPMELQALIDDLIEKKLLPESLKITLDPNRWRRPAGGPEPLAFYLLARRLPDGQLRNRQGKLTLPYRLAEIISDSMPNHYSEAEIEERAAKDTALHGVSNALVSYAWTDKAGRVHLALNEEENNCLAGWINEFNKNNHGCLSANYQPGTGDWTMECLEYRQLARYIFEQTTYLRFMREKEEWKGKFKEFFLDGEIRFPELLGG